MTRRLDLEERVALVTGAGSGLGRATALALAEEGAAVLCVDRDAEKIRGTVDTLRAAGLEAAGHLGDVSSMSDCEEAVGHALEDLGGLDVVVANAGIPGEGRAHDVDIASWQRVLDVNLSGVLLTVRSAIPHLTAQRKGSIVLQASIAGLLGLPNIAAYTAAKGGVVALGRQLAREYADVGIRVNTVAPGPVLTDLVEEAFKDRHGADGMAEALERRRSSVPLGRLGTVEDVAQAVLFFASDRSAWVTGTTLAVDGGLTGLGAMHG